MNNNYETEHEVDLIQVFWEILLRWKPMVLVGLLAMTLVSGYLYLSNGEDEPRVAIVSETSDEEQIKELKQTLSKDDINEVEDLVRRVRALSELREYNHSAALMSINPNNTKELVVSYQLDATNETERAILVHQCVNAVQSNELAERINNVVAPNGDNRYVSDLISVDNTDTYLYIHILVLDEWDGESVATTVRDYLDEQNTNGQITYSDVMERKVYSEDINKRQERVQTGISTERVLIAEAFSKLDGYNSNDTKGENIASHTGQAKLFLLELKQIGLNQCGKEDMTPEEVVGEYVTQTAPAFSKRNALIGFLVGVILFVGVLFLSWMHAPKTGRVMGTGCLEALPMMGLISGEEKINAFWISPFIKKLRDKNRENRETALKNATSSIEFFRNNTGEEKVSLVTIGTVKDATNHVLDELKKEYTVETQKGLTVVSLPTETEKQEQLYKELENLSGAVVVVAEYDVTPLRTLDRMVRLMAEKDIKIIGSLGVE